MATSDSPASATVRARPRGASLWRALGWIGIILWLAMLAVNAAPYLSGRPWPAASDLLPRLLTPPAALGLPPDLAAQAMPFITALAVFLLVLVVTLTISPYRAGGLPIAHPRRAL